MKQVMQILAELNKPGPEEFVKFCEEKDLRFLNFKKFLDATCTLSELQRLELKKQLTLLDLNFFASIVLAIEVELRKLLDEKKLKKDSIFDTLGFKWLKKLFFDSTIKFNDPFSNAVVGISLLELSNHLDWLRYTNPLAELAFYNPSGFIKYIKLIPKLNHWVQEGKDENQRIQRDAALPDICKLFYKETSLSITDSEIDQLPSCLDEFPIFKRLTIPITVKEIPSCLEHLEYLQITMDYIDQINGEKRTDTSSTFPNGLSRLKNLNYLCLQETKLTQIPEEVFELIQLEILVCHYGALKQISPAISKLSNLIILDLNNNEIKNLPQELGSLPKLSELYLSGNSLKELPASLKNLPLLEILQLDDNYISDFPEVILDIKNLTTLNLASNQLTELPKTIQRSKKLTYFYLYANQLHNLPKEIGELSNLKTLDLSHNQLTELPKESSKLIEHCELNLEHNRFMK